MLVDNALTSALYNVWILQRRFWQTEFPLQAFSITNKTCRASTLIVVKGRNLYVHLWKGEGLGWLNFFFLFKWWSTPLHFFLRSSYFYLLCFGSFKRLKSKQVEARICTLYKTMPSVSSVGQSIHFKHTQTHKQRCICCGFFFLIVVAQDE